MNKSMEFKIQTTILFDIQQMKPLQRKSYTHRVAHVGLKSKALWGTEGGGVKAQQPLPVSGRVQALHSPLQHLQARPPGGFKA